MCFEAKKVIFMPFKGNLVIKWPIIEIIEPSLLEEISSECSLTEFVLFGRALSEGMREILWFEERKTSQYPVCSPKIFIFCATTASRVDYLLSGFGASCHRT